MPGITQTDLDNWFTYHAPSEEQQVRYRTIREGAKVFAHILLDNSLTSADQTAAMRKLREVVMTINQSIANEGL